MKSLRLLVCAAALIPAAASPQDLGTPGPQAVKLMTVPPGFKAHLFACEPDIRQPNAFCIDDRGRLWVAENYSYTGPGGPWKPSGKDTILIFEDTDGDGKFDKRTVFADNLSFISGLEVGFGGVWVGSPPGLLFIPDRNGDDKPDGPPVTVLDGWGHHDQHETLNSFMWGPDGWLYGCHGVFTHSKVGKPGAPDNERTIINAAIWRYHPTKQVFEKFAEGTSNPWGVDFDTNGQMFIEACVIPHLWYVIQGGRYHRQGGQHENKYTYEDIKTIADHKHDGIQGRKGGHAHGGARFVMNDAFPPEYQGKFIVGTIHHHGMYTEAFERKDSGFVGKHVGDFMMANDPLYLGFNHDFGPDGGLYVIDWYDPRACHGQTPAHIDTGRIYKITYGDSKKVEVDLSKKSSVELVKLQVSSNEWYVRHARRLLQERGPDPAVHNDLKALYASAPDVPKKLRLLWALHDTGGATEPFLLDQLKNTEEYIRAWAVQLLLEDRKPSPAVLKDLARLAKDDSSAVVRLYVTAAAQRVATSDRWEIVEALATHAEDSGDHNLPSMLWYATEPLVMQDNARAVKLASATKIPRLRELITRRLVAGSSGNAPAPAPSPKAEPAKSVADTALVLRVNPKEVSGKQVEIAGRSGVAFDGHETHLVYPHAAELSFKSSDSFTISAWVHLKDVPQDGWKGVVTKSRDAKPWYGLWIEGEGRWVFGGNRNLMGPSAVTGWQHVCGVQEGGKRRLFVNGALCATGAADDGSGSGELWIGGAKSVREFLEGVIGDVRIYGRALDASEVAYLAQNP